MHYKESKVTTPVKGIHYMKKEMTLGIGNKLNNNNNKKISKHNKV